MTASDLRAVADLCTAASSICAVADLCVGVELRNDEPPFVQTAR
jgi:hypothetical protein